MTCVYLYSRSCCLYLPPFLSLSRLAFFFSDERNSRPPTKHIFTPAFIFFRPLIIPQPMVVGTFHHLGSREYVPSSSTYYYYWTDGVYKLSRSWAMEALATFSSPLRRCCL